LKTHNTLENRKSSSFAVKIVNKYCFLRNHSGKGYFQMVM
jgi:hypothetical protein